MKKFLLLLAVAITALQMSAADVSLSRAQAAASTFLTKQVKAGSINSSAAANLKLVKAEASVFKPTAVDYYIFNTDKSFVVVAGDDLAPQILMYGEEGALDLDNIPPGMQWLLNKYKYQIDGLKAGTMAPVDLPKYASTTPVPPLVTANWDQTKPYYNHTPTSGSTHTYTGCPATSLAMCFYLYKWPATYPALPAISGNSYYGYVAAPALSEKEADWDNMIDEYTGPTNYSYTSAQAEAVSWLMRYVGQACNMEYSTSGSGATDPEILQACHTFGYTDAQLLTLCELVQSGWSYTNGTQNYTDAQWNEWMMNELHSGRPIEYLAYDITSGQVSGHAFNVFGCNSSGQYYVNWGWSGDSNGYCTLHNFTTSTGATGQSGSYTFKYGEAMIIGIAPPSMTTPELTVDPTSLSFTAATGSSVTKTFTVSGTDLRGNVTLSVSGNYYSVSPTTISATEAAQGATVTVTYKPTISGTHSGTVTIKSSGAESKTVSLSGTASIVPAITVDPESLTFNALVNQTVTQTFTLKGSNLTNNVNLDVTGDTYAFSIDKFTVMKSAANNGTTITVTYMPDEVGTTNAAVVITSTGAETVTVPLTGYAAMETYVPVMTPAIEEYINLTQFRADWTDATPAENVASYTLEVAAKSTEPVPVDGGVADFTDIEAVVNDNNQLPNVAETASEYLPDGWTAENYLYINDGFVITGASSSWWSSTYGAVVSPVLDLTGYDKVTVVARVKSYYPSSYGQAKIRILTGAAYQDYTLGSSDDDDYQTVTAVLNCSSSDQVKIQARANYFALEDVKIYAGDITESNRLMAVESGDEAYRLITGITDKFYTVENLTAEGTFLYKVKALYIDGTESEWSNVEEVTLFENGHGFMPGDLDHSGDVNISDVTDLIDYVLDNTMPACPICADVDGSGDVNISDVTELIDMVLSGNNAETLKMMRKPFYRIAE